MIIDNICVICQKCCRGELSGNEECEYNTSTGCSLEYEERAIGCRLYPFIIMENPHLINRKRIVIDTACPHYKLFEDKLDEVKKEIGYDTK